VSGISNSLLSVQSGTTAECMDIFRGVILKLKFWASLSPSSVLKDVIMAVSVLT
jgi:hypothetical protein